MRSIEYQRVRVPRSAKRTALLLRTYGIGGAGAVIITLVVILVVLAPLLSPLGYRKIVARPLQPPLSETASGAKLLLGTDEVGRDMLGRVLYGGRISLIVGLLAPLLGVSIGTLLGIVSGYLGGPADLVLQRFVDTLLVLPGLVIAMTITVAFGFSVPVVIFALAVNNVGGTVRVVRSRVLSLKETQYVDAARAVGASDWRIILRHLAPNCFTLAIVLLAVNVGGAIVAEATLSFLGIGVQPPTPTWGNMLTLAQEYYHRAPHIALIPGAMISIVVLSVNLFGDTLRDVLDPLLRGLR